MYRIVFIIFFFISALETFILHNSLKEYFAAPLFLLCVTGFIVSIITSLVIYAKRKIVLNTKGKRSVARTIIYTVISLIAYNVIIFSLNNLINLNLTEAEIVSTFKENIKSFEIVAEYLEKQPENIECYVENSKVKVVQIDKEYKEKPIYITDRDVMKNLEFILKKLHYKRVDKMQNEINFLLHPVKKENGYDDGIAYYDREVKEDTYLKNQSYSKIFGNWYYFFTGYV